MPDKIACPNCGSTKIQHRGTDENKVKRYQCKNCKKYFRHSGLLKSFSPRILLLDIETAPLAVWTWGLYDQTIYPENVISDWFLLCWSAKWLFDSVSIGEAVTPKEALQRTDRSILAGMWKLVDEADIVITQNGDKFDLRRLNTRWLMEGFKPPMYYRSVDTLKVLKDRFDFSSNGMDYVNRVLGIDGKTKTDFSWWRECLEGEQKSRQAALDRMLKYNKQDVFILEELYLKIRPWITGHPNMNLWTDVEDIEVCPNCKSSDLKWGREYATPLGLWDAFRCNTCGGIGRSTNKKEHKLRRATIRG